MTIEKLKRVFWRLRTDCKERLKTKNTVFHGDFRRAVMKEGGISYSTYKVYRHAAITLGWMFTRHHLFVLTDKDLTEDF